MTDRTAALSWLGTELRLAFTTFSGPQADRAHLSRQRGVDIALVAFAALLPWTTAGALGAMICAFVMLVVTQPPARWLSIALHPAVAPALALFVLCLAGIGWAHGVPKADVVRAVGHVYKLTMIGFLMLHFRASPRAAWVLGAFIVSNAVLLVYSYLVFVAPHLAIVDKPGQPGVPVKNYIDQSHAFAFCAVVLSALAVDAWRAARTRLALVYAVVALGFFANLAFVNLARTALVYLPGMLVVLLARTLSGRRLALALAALVVVAAAAFAVSPNLQLKVSRIFTETATYGQPIEPGAAPASAAMRLEYWEKSLRFIREAPLIGHGTGATGTLFARDAVGKTDLDALVTNNPHNQTLAVALQWGLAGVVLLWAMWIAHLALFRHVGVFAAFVGLVAVVQNMLGSLFNSHLFDFYQGWMYVLAVGIAGGLVTRAGGIRTA